MIKPEICEINFHNYDSLWKLTVTHTGGCLQINEKVYQKLPNKEMSLWVWGDNYYRGTFPPRYFPRLERGLVRTLHD